VTARVFSHHGDRLGCTDNEAFHMRKLTDGRVQPESQPAAFRSFSPAKVDEGLEAFEAEACGRSAVGERKAEGGAMVKSDAQQHETRCERYYYRTWIGQSVMRTCDQASSTSASHSQHLWFGVLYSKYELEDPTASHR